MLSPPGSEVEGEEQSRAHMEEGKGREGREEERGEEKGERRKERRQSIAGWCWKVVPTSVAGTLHDDYLHAGGLVGSEMALIDCGKGLQVWAFMLKTSLTWVDILK